jgi:selT/selW/selH-like putative selenoprotein
LKDAEVTLIPGYGGIFEVVADGELIFSKKASRRVPERGEIVAALRAR